MATVSVAQAQTSSSGSGFSMYSPGSSYIGFNAGRSDFSIGNGTGIFSGDDKDTAYNIYAGSFFNPYLGLELGYTDFGKISRAGGETKAMGFNLSLVGKYPLGTSFNLLGKVGTTYGRTEVSSLPGSGITPGKENGFGVSYGIGAEYLFTPQLSAVAQYDEHRLKFAGTGRDRIGVASLGLRYRF
jgi:OmpA-OmpF porin, OOP family